MENFCIPMANPGKCGFFLLGMFFMLAFASWSIVTRSQEAQEVITNDPDFHRNDKALWEGQTKNAEKQTSDEIYEDMLRQQNYRQRVLQSRIEMHLQNSGLIQREGSKPIATASSIHLPQNKEFERIPTFLSTLDKSFVDLHPDSNGEIPTVAWLEACEGPKELLTGLGSIMSRVWSDVGGNIKTLQERYDSNPSSFATLQKIVYNDIDAGVARDDGSAAMAVLWLKRAFDFVAEFFDNIRHGEAPSTAASNAYEITLSPYHSFLVRPIFYSAMRMLGSKDEILSAMALHEGDMQQPSFEENVWKDIKEYTTGLRLLLKNLDDFLTENNLNT